MQGGAALCTWDRAPGGPGAPEQRGGRGGLSGVAQPAAAVVKGARGSGYTRCGGAGLLSAGARLPVCLQTPSPHRSAFLPCRGVSSGAAVSCPNPGSPGPLRGRAVPSQCQVAQTLLPPPPVRVTPVSAQCQVRAGHLKRWEGRGGGARRGGATQEPGDASAPHQGLSGQRAEKHPWQTPLGTRRQSRAPEPRGGARRGAARALLGTRRRSLWPAGAGGGGSQGLPSHRPASPRFASPPTVTRGGAKGAPAPGGPASRGARAPGISRAWSRGARLEDGVSSQGQRCVRRASDPHVLPWGPSRRWPLASLRGFPSWADGAAGGQKTRCQPQTGAFRIPCVISQSGRPASRERGAVSLPEQGKHPPKPHPRGTPCEWFHEGS